MFEYERLKVEFLSFIHMYIFLYFTIFLTAKNSLFWLKEKKKKAVKEKLICCSATVSKPFSYYYFKDQALFYLFFLVFCYRR